MVRPGEDDGFVVFASDLANFERSSGLLGGLLVVFRQEQLLPLCSSTRLIFVGEIVSKNDILDKKNEGCVSSA